jgi:hypothetical protein
MRGARAQAHDNVDSVGDCDPDSDADLFNCLFLFSEQTQS